MRARPGDVVWGHWQKTGTSREDIIGFSSFEVWPVLGNKIRTLTLAPIKGRVLLTWLNSTEWTDIRYPCVLWLETSFVLYLYSESIIATEKPPVFTYWAFRTSQKHFQIFGLSKIYFYSITRPASISRESQSLLSTDWLIWGAEKSPESSCKATLRWFIIHLLMGQIRCKIWSFSLRRPSTTLISSHVSDGRTGQTEVRPLHHMWHSFQATIVMHT